jgi:hypothetical protein
MQLAAGDARRQAFYERRESRKPFRNRGDLTARCETSDNISKERVHNLSAGGVFLTTRRRFSIGQEIAVTIPLPDSRLAIRATGEIVRINGLGVGVKFKVIFNH